MLVSNDDACNMILHKHQTAIIQICHCHLWDCHGTIKLLQDFMFGRAARALGIGCEHRSPSFRTKPTASATFSPQPWIHCLKNCFSVPDFQCSSAQSRSTTRSCSRGLLPHAASNRNIPNAKTSVPGDAFLMQKSLVCGGHEVVKCEEEEECGG